MRCSLPFEVLKECVTNGDLFARAAKCFDEYIRLRRSLIDDGEAVTIDPRLENIIELMFNRCFDEGGYKEALGIGK